MDTSESALDPYLASGPRILLYSDDVDTRAQVRLAVGPRLHRDAPSIQWFEVATPAAALTAGAAEPWDLLVLDGEAPKNGGMSLARQFKDELADCPPILVLTGRPEDAWLASWSNADGVVAHPLDPVEVQEAVARLVDLPRAQRTPAQP